MGPCIGILANPQWGQLSQEVDRLSYSPNLQFAVDSGVSWISLKYGKKRSWTAPMKLNGFKYKFVNKINCGPMWNSLYKPVMVQDVSRKWPKKQMWHSKDVFSLHKAANQQPIYRFSMFSRGKLSNLSVWTSSKSSLLHTLATSMIHNWSYLPSGKHTKNMENHNYIVG